MDEVSTELVDQVRAGIQDRQAGSGRPLVLRERVEELLDAHDAEVDPAAVACDQRVEALHQRARDGTAGDGLQRAGRRDA